MKTKKTDKVKKSKKVLIENSIIDTISSDTDTKEIEAINCVETEQIPVITEKSELDKIEELKQKVLLSLNSPDFVFNHLSKFIYELLVKENKIVCSPTSKRQSSYHSLPYSMPFDFESENKSQGAFSGTRGRCFLALMLKKSGDDFLKFEEYNRKLEGANETDLIPHFYYRTLQAQYKAYFTDSMPKSEFKTLYPVKMFPDTRKVKTPEK